MKTLFKAAITTGVLATGLAIATPADALVLNFSYSIDPDLSFQGFLEGEIREGDANLVDVSKMTWSFSNGNGSGGVARTVTRASDMLGLGLVSFNGSAMDFFAQGDVGSLYFGSGVNSQVSLIFYNAIRAESSPMLLDAFIPSRWSLTSVIPPRTPETPTTPVPTPAAILPVLAGLFGAATKRNQKEA